MKLFRHLTEAELTALNEEEIQRYIDYACAEEGIPLLPSLPPEPKEVEFKPDAKLYRVGYRLQFATLEDATRVMEAITAAGPIVTMYIQTPSNVPSTVITNRRDRSVAVTTEEAFTEEKAEQLRQELAGAKAAEDIYAKAKKDYDHALAARDSINQEIRAEIGKAWEAKNHRESLQRDFDRYLVLSDGDRRIAARFLQNAKPEARTLLPDLFQEDDPPPMPRPKLNTEESRDEGVPF